MPAATNTVSVNPNRTAAQSTRSMAHIDNARGREKYMSMKALIMLSPCSLSRDSSCWPGRLAIFLPCSGERRLPRLRSNLTAFADTSRRQAVITNVPRKTRLEIIRATVAQARPITWAR